MTRITPYSLVRGTLATVILAGVATAAALLSPFLLAAGILILAAGCISCSTWSDFRDAASDVMSDAWRDIKCWLKSYRGCWTERT